MAAISLSNRIDGVAASKRKSGPGAARVPFSIRVDGSVLSALKTEAEHLRIPYQK
jgi:hypothetical protein